MTYARRFRATAHPSIRFLMNDNFTEDRYATLKLIDWFNFDRVRNARMLVIGAGAIGNEVLKNLALLGVGNVFIYDCDTVETSNLTRSILFRVSDTGRLKAEAAAHAVASINPDVHVDWRKGDVRFDLGLGLIRRMDVVIGCLDNREARLMVNAKCYRAGCPWIDAGIETLNGQINVYRPPQGVCYECAFTKEDYQQVSMSCNWLASKYASEGKVPTTPTMASIVAGVQVQEALKLLAYEEWHGRSLVGRELTYNGTIEYVSITNLPRRHDCLAHGTINPKSIIELRDATTAQTTFAQLLNRVQEHLGPGASVILNFDLALGVSCIHCGLRKELFEPAANLFKEDICCQECGHNGEFHPGNDLTSTISETMSHYTALRDRTLASIRIPPLDILTGVGADGSIAYFELTGDEPEFKQAFGR